ncbi:HAD-IA family hydrolase [Microlunatus sp. Y2014]|uniref:HAD-IA family hydrolase n=1 Tax=Microlunatus sp. Y2014 TaxID=3418488 RepID=UPI003DA75AA0
MTHLIWDLGGTLLDTYPDVDRTLCLTARGTVSEAGLAEVARLTRISSGHAIRELSRRHGVPEQDLRAAYDSLKERWRTEPAPVMAGAREVLDVVTSGGGLNLVATHRDRASATVLLDTLGLRVDDLVCAPDGYPRKPDPAMITHLLERHALSPASCLAVGDRTGDMGAAVAADVPAVLLETPGIPLDAAGADRIISLSELLPLLRR